MKMSTTNYKNSTLLGTFDSILTVMQFLAEASVGPDLPLEDVPIHIFMFLNESINLLSPRSSDNRQRGRVQVRAPAQQMKLPRVTYRVGCIRLLPLR